jgi:hypothetical protein
MRQDKTHTELVGQRICPAAANDNDIQRLTSEAGVPKKLFTASLTRESRYFRYLSAFAFIYEPDGICGVYPDIGRLILPST